MSHPISIFIILIEEVETLANQEPRDQRAMFHEPRALVNQDPEVPFGRPLEPGAPGAGEGPLVATVLVGHPRECPEALPWSAAGIVH